MANYMESPTTTGTWIWTMQGNEDQTQTEANVDGDNGNDNANDCILFHIFVQVALHPFLIVFGLIGNCLTMAMLWSDQHKTATYYIIFWLAVADCFILVGFGMFTVPVGILISNGQPSEAMRLQIRLAVYWSPMCTVFLSLSIWLTVLVTWYRYINVCIPFKAKEYGNIQQAKKQTRFLLIFAVIFHFPRWFEQHALYDFPRPGMTLLVKKDLAENRVYQILYQIILYYTTVYIAPIFSLLYMTHSLIRALRESHQKRLQMTTGVKLKKDDLTFSLIVVVIVFIICQFFVPVRRILVVLYPEPSARRCGGVLFYYQTVSATFVLINSAVNFIIYVLFAKRLRKRFKSMLWRCGFVHNQVTPQGTQDAQDTN